MASLSTNGDKTMYINKKMKCVSVGYGCAGMFKPGEIYMAQKLKSSTGSFYVSNSKGHRMFLNGGEGTKVMAHAMVIAEFEEVK